jgi:hypothetical protein
MLAGEPPAEICLPNRSKLFVIGGAQVIDFARAARILCKPKQQA